MSQEFGMRNVRAIVLGGGRGTRLYPLTLQRAKPAVPLAGKYRLIDIPVSNCINSDITRIFVLTQFNSASLNRHISRTFQFSYFSNSLVEVLAAQQTPENQYWFQGTADAVRQHMPQIKGRDASEYLILSGDHLYRMDYRHFINHHRNSGADVTISVIPVTKTAASEFGLMKIDDKGMVVEFREKPSGPELEEMQVDTKSLGLDAKTAKRKPYIASMGIYVFKPEVLTRLLAKYPQYTDFGKEILPAALEDCKVSAYLFDGYWEDIGTVESFYESNLELVKQPATTFSFYDARAPIFTRPRQLPPNKVKSSQIKESMICEGCLVKEEAKISNSIIGIRSRIESGAVIEDSLVMGADIYQSPEERAADVKQGLPPIGIGKNSHIKRAIIDKNARIGENVKIINKDNEEEVRREKDGYCISNGIVIIIKNAVIPDNTVI